ncbi:MAG: hypothetical protein AAF216_00715 [Pseudomonadota bacterium]
MKFLTTASRATLTAVAAAALVSVAHANETEAGRSVDNTFTLDYAVDTVPQGTITNDPTYTKPNPTDPDPVVVGSGPTAFTVDRLIDLSLTAVTGTLTVPPNAQDRVLEFTLTNDGNDNQAYSFWIDELSSDDFDADNIEITYSKPAYNLNPEVETGQSGTDTDETDTCEAALTDEPITLLGALGAAAASPGSVDNFSCPIPPDGTITIKIVGDIPPGVTDGDESDNFLYAQTRDPLAWLFETTSLTHGTLTTGDDGTNVVGSTAENVFADADGDGGTANDGDTDGIISIEGTYTIRDPDLTAAKDVYVWDTGPVLPADCEVADVTGVAPTDQYFVPGACVKYVITVTNTAITAGSDADGIDLVDVLPQDLEFVEAVAADFDTAGTLTFKRSNGTTDCDGTEGGPTLASETCTITLTGASLDATAGVVDNVATLTITALVR